MRIAGGKPAAGAPTGIAAQKSPRPEASHERAVDRRRRQMTADYEVQDMGKNPSREAGQ
jgi:hypothetical protein